MRDKRMKNEKKMIDIDSLNDDIINSLKKNLKFIQIDKHKAYKYEGGKKI